MKMAEKVTNAYKAVEKSVRDNCVRTPCGGGLYIQIPNISSVLRSYIKTGLVVENTFKSDFYGIGVETPVFIFDDKSCVVVGVETTPELFQVIENAEDTENVSMISMNIYLNNA